jgi:hypothetical protein
MATKPKAASKPEAKPSPSQRLNEIGIEEICEAIENKSSLRSWCIENNFVLRTALNWIEADEERSSHYARSREARADAFFDELDDVSEQAVFAETAVQVAGLRLKADNIKWKLARMNAKKYGEKQTIDMKAEVTTLTDDQRRERLAELQKKLSLHKK